MDEWQKQYIHRHLVDLMVETIPNVKIVAKLFEEKILSRDEMQKMEKTIKRKTQSEASKLLFDIIPTRKNSYKIFGKVAYDTGQSGTFFILLKGLVSHLLQQSGIELEELVLDRILKDCEPEDTIAFFLRKTDNQNLFQDNWIPEPHGGIYIPRYISNIVKVNAALFMERCSDVFVFREICRSDLSRLVQPNVTTSSTDVLLQRNVTPRFVLLETEQDWDRLRVMLSIPHDQTSRNKKPHRFVHLIQYDRTSKECILLRSTGHNQLISKHVVSHVRDNSLYVSEEQFIKEIKDSGRQNVFCICDSPGMGKTWLLLNLARKLQRENLNRMVAFISLSEFTQTVNLFPKEPSVRISGISTLLKFLCPCRLMHSLFIEALKCNKIHLELFLDGFDEISEQHLESAKAYFYDIAKSEKSVRLFVTLRPHMRHDLEQTFHAIAYDIMPFSEEDQIEYLVGFWKSEGVGKGNEETLRKFAVACLQTLKKSLTKEEGDLMGIPLYCHLLAMVNLMNAALYCSREETGDPEEFVSSTSMDDMYSTYVEMGVNRATKYSSHSTTDKDTQDNTISPEKKAKLHLDGSPLNGGLQRQKLKTFHVWKALELLHPELAEVYLQSHNLSDREPSPEIFSCGLLQMSPSKKDGSKGVTFLHRTFAEFLVAEIFAEVFINYHTLKKDEKLQEFADIAFICMLNVISDVTLNFLNASLKRMASNPLPTEEAMDDASSLKKYNFSAFLKKAISSSHVYIVRQIKTLLCQAFSPYQVSRKLLYCNDYDFYNNPATETHYRSCLEYLCFAAEHSNVAMVEELYSLYENCFGENLDDTLADLPYSEDTPLHRALKQRNYYLVEYFSDRISLSGRRLLYHCVQNTLKCSVGEVQLTIDICKLLLGKCDKLLHEHGLSASEDPLYAERVHVKVIKCLILYEDNGQAIQFQGDNLVLWHFHWMEKEEFCELCRFLIYEVTAFPFFRPKVNKWRDPLPDIIGGINVTALEYILQVPEVDLNVLDEQGNNLVQRCIHPESDLNVVKLLVKKGVNLHHKNKCLQGALHVAVENNNMEFVQYLLSQQLSLEDQDNMGNMPLHLAHNNLEMVKYLASRNANVQTVNHKGNSIAHLAARQGEAWKDDVMGYLVASKRTRGLFKAPNSEGYTPIDILHTHNYFLNKQDTTINEIPHGSTAEIGFPLILLAIKSGQSNLVLKELLEEGINVMPDDPLKKVGLHLAAQKGNLKAIKHLVSLGLPLECRDDEGNTPLLLAATYRQIEIVKYLILQNANPWVEDNCGNNMAHKLGGDFATGLSFLQKYGSLLKARNKEGRTPLDEWITKGVSLDPVTVEKVRNISCLEVADHDGPFASS